MPSPPKPAPETTPPAENDPLAGLVRGRIVNYWPTPVEARNTHDDGPWPSMVTNVSIEFPGQVTLNVNMPKVSPIGADPVCRKEAVLFSAAGSDFAGGWTWPSR